MAPQFFTDLQVRWLGDDLAELLAPLVYKSDLLGEAITVPAHFVTDYASVPRVLPLTYALFGGKARMPAVVHDFLYQTHQVNGKPIEKWQADAVFKEAMIVDGISKWRAYDMWLGVKLFGFSSWKSGPSRFKILS